MGRPLSGLDAHVSHEGFDQFTSVDHTLRECVSFRESQATTGTLLTFLLQSGLWGVTFCRAKYLFSFSTLFAMYDSAHRPCALLPCCRRRLTCVVGASGLMPHASTVIEVAVTHARLASSCAGSPFWRSWGIVCAKLPAAHRRPPCSATTVCLRLSLPAKHLPLLFQ